LEIQEQRQGAVTVLKPRGPLCAQDADQFKQRALSVLDKSLGRFVVDASDVPYLDSRGLEVLKETSDKLSEGGRALRLCAANETVREILELTDLSQHFEHFSDVGSAVRSFL
jgi:anti-anti-sigma factor